MNEIIYVCVFRSCFFRRLSQRIFWWLATFFRRLGRRAVSFGRQWAWVQHSLQTWSGGGKSKFFKVQKKYSKPFCTFRYKVRARIFPPPPDIVRKKYSYYLFWPPAGRKIVILAKNCPNPAHFTYKNPNGTRLFNDNNDLL
jgi:hypothetical protein